MKLFSFFKKYRHKYAIALLALIVYEALDMISPQVTKSIIDDCIVGQDAGVLPKLLLALVIVGIGRVIFGYIREFTFDKTSFRIGSDIRKKLLHHVQGLSVDYFDRTNTGEIMARIKDDVDNVQASFGYVGMLILQVIFHTGMILFCMFRLSPKLAIFPVIALPLCGALAVIMERKLNRVYDDISEENAKMNTVAEENLAGVRVVKAFAREKFEISKFLGHNKKYYELNMQQSEVWIRYNPIFQLIGKLLAIASILWGGLMVIDGEMSLGTLGAFEEYCANAVWPMEMLGWLSNSLASSFASKKKIDKVFAEVPMIKEPEENNDTEVNTMGGEAAEGIIVEESTSEGGRFAIRKGSGVLRKLGGLTGRLSGRISFENVSLKIGDKQILRDITFDIPAGKTLGIMGPTGSGKTSIVNMLLRFYDAETGAVRLDGEDVRKLPLKTVRENAAVVMQDVFLFSDTVEENVRLGLKDCITPSEIEEALDKSCAAPFVGKLSDREKTIIGERGVGLSGGQKQRISMARAFAKHAPVLVLDDATSALDMETEREVQKNLYDMKDRTKIIIAHRISSVRKADEIIILENGRIAERGTHDELMARKGYYYQTYCAQYSRAVAGA